MKKVLIADDYPDMRELLGKQLERLGFHSDSGRKR